MERRFPAEAGLSDAQRCALAVRALRDGTAARLRALHGWSCEDLARACNVSTHLIRRWERGIEKPSAASALKMWRVLNEACTHLSEGAVMMEDGPRD